MPPAPRLLRWCILLLSIVGLALALWWRLRPQPIRVALASVEQGLVERLVANTRAGTIKACRRADLSPGVGGQISRLEVKKGDRVQPGALLVEIWNDNLLAQVALSKSEGQAAKARAAAIKQQLDKAERDANRLRQLHDKAINSEQDLDTALTAMAIAQAQHAAALAEEQSSRDRLQVLAAELERSRLLAPFAGVVAEVNGELNEYVTPSPPGIPTPPVVVLLDTSCFTVSAPIDEVDASAIKVDMPTRIRLDAFGGRVFAGHVRQIDPYVLDREKQARTVQVEVEFDQAEAGESLLTGYSADVEIVVETRANCLHIPSQAIIDGGRVLVFDPDSGLLSQRQIGTGLANWEQTEVVSGLKLGERVVLTTDRPGVKDGVKAIGESGP